MAKNPSKIEVINAFKEFEKSLLNLSIVLKNDKSGNQYVDRTFETVGECPLSLLTMEKQVDNIKGWVEYIEKEILSMK